MALNKHCEQQFGTGKWERWDYDLEAGTLVFSQAGTPKVVAEIQVVGTTSAHSYTWLWSWANESLISVATKEMSTVRQFGIENDIRQLTESSLSDDGYLGWELTAVSVALLNGKGAYRLYQNEGEWNDANSEHLKIKLICHHCYEGIKLMQAGNSFREDF